MTETELIDLLYALPDEKYVSVVNMFWDYLIKRPFILPNTEESINLLFAHTTPSDILRMMQKKGRNFHIDDKWYMVDDEIKSSDNPRNLSLFGGKEDLRMIAKAYLAGTLPENVCRTIEVVLYPNRHTVGDNIG